MQNGIESINYEQSVNATSENSYAEFDRAYKSGKCSAIANVIQILNQMELDYYDKGSIDYSKVCAHLRGLIYDI